MFENAGKTIKSYARTLFVVISVIKWIALVLAGILIGQGTSYHIWGLNQTSIWAIIVLIGVLSTASDYLAFSFIYAMGDTADNIKEIKERLNELEDEYVEKNFGIITEK